MKWEYHTRWIKRSSNTLEEELQREGYRGWELVQVLPDPDSYTVTAIFKRPIDIKTEKEEYYQ